MDNLFKENFDELLQKQWLKTFDENKDKFRNSIVFQYESIGRFYKIHNKEFSKNKNGRQKTKENESVSKVFSSFDEEAFNFNKIDNWQRLLQINDIGNEINPEDPFHDIIVNISPLSKYHSLIIIFPEDQLPQFLGPDILEIIMNLISLSKSPYLKISYNSWNAASSINHLHFQLNYCNSIIPELENLPIELTKQVILTNSAKIEYLTNIQILIGIDYPIRFFHICLKNESEFNEKSKDQILNCANLIIKILLSEDIPHNILISDGGKSIYILPRKADSIQKDLNIVKLGWLELCGVCLVNSEDNFNKLTESQFEHILVSVSLNEEEFTLLSKIIIDSLY